MKPNTDDTKAPKTPLFECPICVHDFKSASALTVHMQTVHGK